MFKYIRGKALLKYEPSEIKAIYGIQIIHQTWTKLITHGIPKKHVPYVRSWEEYHPDALHVLWTDEDNDELIRLYYPHYYRTYKTFVLVIQQCDFARLLYLHRYGGVYADLDYEAHVKLY